MKLTVLPFGNGRVDEEAKKISCQHGLAECDANTYELCAIELVHNHAEDYLPFLVCTAQSLPAGYRDQAFATAKFRKCARKAGLWFEALEACHDSESMAWHVNWQAYRATPDHPYVPYVLVEGSEWDDRDADLATEICRLYEKRGGTHPKCKELLANKDSATPWMHQVKEVCPNPE